MSQKVRPIISTSTPQEVMISLGAKCERCGHCCKYGSAYILDEELHLVAKYLAVEPEEFKRHYLEERQELNRTVYKLKHGGNKPFGPCILYDERIGCLVHEVKPLYCKIASCSDRDGEALQWFRFNMLLDKEDPEALRQWNQLMLHTPKRIVGASIEEIIPDKDLRFKILSYEIMTKDDLKNYKAKEESK
ncbi:MAG: YkgJ family cysteine cluster protein [Candidatus Woesearchaeota archaeon]